MKFDRVLPSVILLELVIEVIEASNEAKLVEISVVTFSVTTVGTLVQFQVGDGVVSSENKIYNYFESFVTISLQNFIFTFCQSYHDYTFKLANVVVLMGDVIGIEWFC